MLIYPSKFILLMKGFVKLCVILSCISTFMGSVLRLSGRSRANQGENAHDRL